MGKRSLLKPLFAISLCLNILIAGYVFYSRYKSRNASNKAFADQWNKIREDVLQNVKIDTGDIVFIGTSLTEGFPLSAMYPDLPVKNLGISGNWSEHILERLPGVLKARPRLLFIEAGTNDLQSDDSSFYKNYAYILRLVKASGIKTYTHLVPPTSMDKEKYNNRVTRYNTAIKMLCAKDTIPVIDIYSVFLKQGRMDSLFTGDGVHVNGLGYRKWKQLLDPYLSSRE